MKPGLKIPKLTLAAAICLACGYCGFLIGVTFSGNPSSGISGDFQKKISSVTVDGKSPQSDADARNKSNIIDQTAPSGPGLFVSVPAKTLNNLINNPFTPGLVPNLYFLQALGMTPEQSKSAISAFGVFKNQLEQIEVKHSKLVKGPDGDHIEISPYDFPKSECGQLKDALINVTGKEDWRVDMLMSCVENMNTTGGLGKFRQEIAVEKQDDPGGGSFDMIKVKGFDLEGRHVLMAGFGLRQDVPVERYTELFKKYATE